MVSTAAWRYLPWLWPTENGYNPHQSLREVVVSLSQVHGGTQVLALIRSPRFPQNQCSGQKFDPREKLLNAYSEMPYIEDAYKKRIEVIRIYRTKVCFFSHAPALSLHLSCYCKKIEIVVRTDNS